MFIDVFLTIKVCNNIYTEFGNMIKWLNFMFFIIFVYLFPNPLFEIILPLKSIFPSLIYE